MKRALGIVAIAIVALVSACSTGPANHTNDQLSIYATTGYLADAVRVIAPDASVTTMVGPGGDPHTYQPSTQDIQRISSADLVLWNGLFLEAHLVEVFEQHQGPQLAVGPQISPDRLLPWDLSSGSQQLYDPHIWNNPLIWADVVVMIGDALAEVDPVHADTYQSNASRYSQEILELDEWARATLSSVPTNQRTLVTGHDAFGYLGDTYGFDVHATDFISADAVLSPRELSDLAKFIADNHVPVIFFDNQASPQAITALQEASQSLGWPVATASEDLYADSLGIAAPVDTYIGVFRHNVETIADALSEG